jgi:carboxyl-terminal processing protease
MTEEPETIAKKENQERKLQRFSNLLLGLSVVLLIFGAGYRVGEYYTKKGQQAQSNSVLNLSQTKPATVPKDFDLFWSVWSLIEQKYADQKKVKPQKMLYGAIKGLVASLEDPYSYFMTPSENEQSKDSLGGKYEGIGAELGMKENRIVVVAPLENSPAQAAGLLAGDIILAVDEKKVAGWSLNQAVEKIRGKKGTVVKLTVSRQNEEQDISIKRDQIKVDSVKLSYKQDVAYLKVSSFGDDTISGWDMAVEEIKNKWQSKKISGLIIDVRSNPGGYLEASVYLASEFLPQNSLVISQEYADQPTKEYKVTRQGKLLDIPTVVLINEGSASASEIFAGSLRDYNRAKLIGKKTYGKGSVQEALDLNNNTGLHLTIAKWVLPEGDWINAKGIKPEIEVDIDLKDGNTLEDKTDAQLQKAIEVITEVK